MLVIENERIIASDVDDTLVLWSDNCYQPHDGAIRFVDPYDNSVVYLTPHQRHIDLLKKWKGRGYFIEVWSAAGVKWAETVVRTLKLQDTVDLVSTKREKYLDDLLAHEVLGMRVYLDPKSTNKVIEFTEE